MQQCRQCRPWCSRPVGQSPHRRSRSSGGQTHQDPPGPTTLMSPLHCNLLCCTFTYPRHCFGMCISLPNTLLADCTMQLHSAGSAHQHNATAVQLLHSAGSAVHSAMHSSTMQHHTWNLEYQGLQPKSHRRSENSP